MSDHKPTCSTVVYAEQDKALLQAHAAAHNTYMKTWPSHCSHCRGRGVFFDTYDPSPAGVSLAAGTMTDVCACHVCLENDLCPRCGGPAPFNEARELSSCLSCGFAELETEGLPEPPQLAECDCWSLEDATS